MEPSCVRQDLVPGTSKLFIDYLYCFEKVASFYSSHFSDGDGLIRAGRELTFPDSRRAQLVDALRAQNGDSPTLARLAQPGTVAVVSGQQVGLFSGPAYTIFKALTAVKLAEHLSANGVSAVPIFWLATEDHDLAEVDHSWIFNQDAVPSKVSLADAISSGEPVGQVRLGGVPLEDLRSALGSLPFAEPVLERVAAAYKPDATLGSAFRDFLRELLAPYGLLYLDPLAPEIRQITAPFMSDVAGRVPELISALRERDQALAAAGYHSQVLVDDDSSLLFLLQNGKRVPIRYRGERFVTRERTYTAAELQALATQLSPNALLRPVMQDFLIPTVSYVGGPAEIAYLAQSQVLYRLLLGRMPFIYPRNSFTLLDARATKLLNRFGLQVPDLLDYAESVRAKLAAKLVPAGLNAELERWRSAAAASLGTVTAQLTSFDPTLAASSQKSAVKIRYQMQKLSDKVAQEALRRDKRANDNATYLLNLVYPHRRLQERIYSVVPFLAKYGLDLPQQLFGEIQLACPDHMIRTF